MVSGEFLSDFSRISRFVDLLAGTNNGVSRCALSLMVQLPSQVGCLLCAPWVVFSDAEHH